MFGASVATILLPLTANNFPLVVFCRVLIGLFEAVCYPTFAGLIARWFPDKEKTRAISLVVSGSAGGTIMAMIVSGPIIESRGWPYVFYFFGFLGFCWCVLWILIGASSASTSKLISQEELDYIQANTTRTAATQKEIPWKTIFSSVHFWALVINYFTNNWGFYIILTWLPTYLEEELHFDLKENTFISFLPYLAQLLVILPVGRIADFMIEKKIKKPQLEEYFKYLVLFYLLFSFHHFV